jgi:ribonuclease P protein component
VNPQPIASKPRAKRAASGAVLSVRVLEGEKASVRFSIPRRLGTAVARNRLRRQLREIVRRWPPRHGIGVLVTAQRPGGTFQELEEDYLYLMRGLDLLDG